MSYHLYYSAGACSMLPHTMLIELGLPFTASIAPNAQSPERADYEKNVSTLGASPALVLPDQRILTQNIAIVDCLASRVPENAFLPADSDARTQALRWLSFAAADLHPAFKPAFRPAAFLADDSHSAALKKSSEAMVLKLYQHIEPIYAQQSWIAGDFSAADLYIYITYRWANKLGFDLSSLPALQRMTRLIEQRPSIQAVLLANDQLPLNPL